MHKMINIPDKKHLILSAVNRSPFRRDPCSSAMTRYKSSMYFGATILLVADLRASSNPMCKGTVSTMQFIQMDKYIINMA